MASAQEEARFRKAARSAGDLVVDTYTKVVDKVTKLAKEDGGLKDKTERITNSLAESIGVPPFLIPVGFILILFTTFGFMDKTITNCVGFFYPAWQSFHAIETTSPDDDRQWLTYWVVYSAFTTMELFANLLLSWIPFYYSLKITFLLWLFLPQFRGALVIYSKILRPLLIQHQRQIDGVFDKVAQTLEPETKKTI